MSILVEQSGQLICCRLAIQHYAAVGFIWYWVDYVNPIYVIQNT
ncbi:hypothetical protein [Thiospirillum jenense]|nr:hypothetical protein [Thiospirillum jenense]